MSEEVATPPAASTPPVGSANDYRRRLAKPVELPSGAVFLMRRPRLDLWLSSGRVPQSLLAEGIEAWKETEDGQEVQDLLVERAEKAIAEDEKQTAEFFVFLRELVCDAVVSPRIVEGADPTSDTEIDPSEITAEDFTFITEWVTQAWRAPVETKTGEVEGDGLRKFRKGRGRTPRRARKDGGKVGEESRP